MTNKIFIGWDIGGANTKICLFDSEYNVIDVINENIKIWENFENLKFLFVKINNDYHKYEISNFITITAESCDNFSERNDGILKILELCNNFMIGKTFYFSNEGVYLSYHDAKLLPHKLFSTNWMLTLNFLNSSSDIDVIIDIGSTTTDVIYKNMSIHNNIDDYQRLQNNTLIYIGAIRTPLSMVIENVIYKGLKTPLINEVYATTGDIFNITNDVDFRNTNYKGADGKSFTKKNSLIRLSRNIGFDYSDNNDLYLLETAKKIKKLIIDKIFIYLKNVVDIKLKNSMVSSIGEGKFIIQTLCEKNNIKYKHIEDIDSHIVKINKNHKIYINLPSALVVLNSIGQIHEKT